MITKEKGYSLNVLVITIAVMLILTTTAIVTMQNLTSDRAVTQFMNDLQEVEQFVKEYYSRKSILPTVYENGREIEFSLTDEMQLQADENDKGKYFRIDLDKLGDLNLYDDDRGGYILNESTLKIYVVEPIEYNEVKYYTITDEMLGIDKTYGNVDTFEVMITGNPVMWTSNFKLMVSIPDHQDVNSNWSFKYYKDGPITAEQFKTLGSFFEYGKAIDIDENGIHSIYVENEEGHAKVVNVVVNKIDEIDPYVYLTNEQDIVVGDDETGIKSIMYKIVDYSIPENERAGKIETYFQGTRSHLPDRNQGGRWTFEEAYTGEKIDAAIPSVGKSINTYRDEYEAYLTRYTAIMNDPSGDSGDLQELEEIYPQFQHNGVPYEDDEQNIVLYVEDYAGNRSVTDENNYMFTVSREMLLDSNFIETIIKPLRGAKVIVNDGAEYTTQRKVSLSIRAQGAESMFITTDEGRMPAADEWIPFETVVNEYELPEENGNTNVYVYVTANQTEDGNLIYEKVSDGIFLDNTKPTTTAPEVPTIGNDLKLKVTNKQKDDESGIDKVEYGFKLKDETRYTWVDDLSNIVLEPRMVYTIKTRTTDKAGNVEESEETEIQCPLQVARTLPNEPAMATGMQAIVWDGTLARPGEELEIDPVTWETASGEETTWYNYSIGDGITDTRDNIWANAKTADGSYWVWIPRFAYRIIYYEDADKSVVKGYYQNSVASGMQYFESDGVTVTTNPDEVKTQNATIDVIFLNGTSNSQYKEENITTKAITIKSLPSEYIVHPAFQRADSTAINNSLGRWSSELTGIWVAKFEASRSNATIEDIGDSTVVKSVPSVKSWSDIKIEDAYNYCINMYPALYSHLMKNSEWGAVAYLAYSPYGRNGNEISSNRSMDYITGGGGSTSAYTCSTSKFESTYAYNVRDNGSSTAGMYASTTGNIYGVFDMAGGVAEFVATYVNNGDGAIQANGSSLTQTSTPSLRDVYSPADTDSPINNYKKNGITDGIYGNAIFETSTGYIGSYGFESDTSNYPSGNKPFFIRGGKAISGTESGVFNFDTSDGDIEEATGFRPVLAFR